MKRTPSQAGLTTQPPNTDPPQVQVFEIPTAPIPRPIQVQVFQLPTGPLPAWPSSKPFPVMVAQPPVMVTQPAVASTTISTTTSQQIRLVRIYPPDFHPSTIYPPTTLPPTTLPANTPRPSTGLARTASSAFTAVLALPHTTPTLLTPAAKTRTRPPGPYSAEKLALLDELRITTASPCQLQELSHTLPSNTSITMLCIEAAAPGTVLKVLQSMVGNASIQELEIRCDTEQIRAEVMPGLRQLLKEASGFSAFRLVVDGRSKRLDFADQRLFETLCSFKNLSSVKVYALHKLGVFLDKPESLIQALANSPIKQLTLSALWKSDSFLSAVFDGLALNNKLETLSLWHQDLTGHSEKLLALLQRKNPALNKLKLNSCRFQETQLHALFEAAAQHPTLEKVSLLRVLPALNFAPSDNTAAAGRVFAISPQLKELRLSIRSDPNNIAAIIQGLQGNTSLRLLDLGSLSHAADSNSDELIIDSALEQLYASNTQLRIIKVSLQDMLCWHPQNIFKGLARSSSITSVWIDELKSVVGLAELIQSHSKIQHIRLGIKANCDFVQLLTSMEAAALAALHNTQLTDFKFEFNDLLSRTIVGYKQDSKLHSRLETAVREIQKVGRRNALMNDVGQAGQGMWATLLSQDLDAQGDTSIPSLPLDVTLQLAHAVATYLEPAQAEAVFKELMPFGTPSK